MQVKRVRVMNFFSWRRKYLENKHGLTLGQQSR